MNSKTENKICVNCSQNFTIEPEDFLFYERVKVPAPTWCPECRQLRRYAWRNERTLYKRNCDLCQKSMVTIYSQNKPYTVYCSKCWWGDGWDASQFGRDFDFSRPFFEQFGELQHQVPRLALLSKNSVNSEYTNHSADNKNAYLSFAIFSSENIMNSTWVMKSRECADCSFIYDKGERLYECIDSRTSYQSQYGLFLKDCSTTFYCYDCHSCNECFMSSNLRNKSYVFRNVQLTREEYLEKMKEIDFSSFVERERLYNEFQSMREKVAIHRYVISERNINSVGSLLYDCKDVKKSFELNDGENCKYIYGGVNMKDCMDLYHVGWPTTELCYEMHGCTRVVNCSFCHLCYDNMNISYCDTCQNSQNLFACVSVKKGEYMILNKKYNKADYEILRNQIIEHMKSTGEYGEFLPPSIAPVSYNETQGNLYSPLTREEVLSKGWKWEDQIPGTFGKETIAPEDLPDSIKEVGDDILGAILRCMDCSKNYNITSNELGFYRKENIPLPRRCPNCRYKKRFDLRPPRRLWAGVCKCESGNHDHEGRCQNEFETAYSPDRVEKVYCESCYNKEIY